MTNQREDVFLTAQWRHLAMVNFEIDPTLLQPYLPGGVELDTWKDRTFVSLVGFNFLDVRVHGIPIPFHRNFEEINLRFYVRSRQNETWKRGVVFIKEIVPKAAVALVARSLYNERYIALPTKHSIQLTDNAGDRHVRYEWKFADRWNFLQVHPEGEARMLEAGSEEEFITEHYWGYSAQKDGGTKEYRVDHPPWRVWQVAQARMEVDIRGLYGDRFVETLTAKPSSAFLADGSDVAVFHGCRI